jgi:hypothetical protein
VAAVAALQLRGHSCQPLARQVVLASVGFVDRTVEVDADLRVQSSDTTEGFRGDLWSDVACGGEPEAEEVRFEVVLGTYVGEQGS